MKNLVLLPILAFVLSSCAWLNGSIKPEQPVAVSYKYVISLIPDDLMKIPNPVYKIDPKTSTDKDAARWMLESEQRALNLEQQLNAIKKYQDDKIKSILELKIDKNDIIYN